MKFLPLHRMNNDALDEDLYEVYIRSLRDHLENKKYFLRQAKDAIGSLQTRSNDDHLMSDGKWQALLKKPMFFPERSDPIGLSLLSVSMATRKETSLKWLEYMSNHLQEVSDLVKYQKNTNRKLLVLVELLEQRISLLEQVTKKTPIMPKSPTEYNQHLLKSLDEFVKSYLAIDMGDAEDAGFDIYDDIMSIIKRLVNYDTTLKISDFHHSSKCFYRLLLRSNLIELENKEDGERYVKLLDFANSDIS